MASLQQIISWFKEGLFPTEDQFRQTWLSYWHKSEKIPQSQVFGLQETIESATQGLIYRPPVATSVELNITYPDAKTGWAAIVEATGTIWQCEVQSNGTKVWSDTGLREFPKDVVTQEDLDETLQKVYFRDNEEFKTDSDLLLAKSSNNNLAFNLNIQPHLLSSNSIVFNSSEGYSVVKSENSIKELNSPYKFVVVKDSGSVLYPGMLKNNTSNSVYSFGMWLKKEQYVAGLVAHITAYFGASAKYKNLTFAVSEQIVGRSKFSSDSDFSVTAKIVAESNGYIYLQYQFTSGSVNPSNCLVLPYPVGGAITDVNYEYAGLYASNSIDEINPFVGSYYAMTYQSLKKNIREGMVRKNELNGYVKETDIKEVDRLGDNDFLLLDRYGSSTVNLADEINKQPDIESFNGIEFIASDGYLISKSENLITELNSPYKFVVVKDSGSVLYPGMLKNNTSNSVYSFGMWLKKEQYVAGLVAHITAYFGASAKYKNLTFAVSEQIVGRSKFSSDSDFSVTAKIVAESNGYIYLQYQFTSGSVNPSNCLVLPYPVGGAITDVNYEYAGLYASNSIDEINPFFEGILKIQASKISIGGNSETTRVKLSLPDTINADFGRTLYIFKHCITTAFNYRNYNIQVIMGRDVVNGKDYHRYWQYTPANTGEVKVTFLLYDNSRNLLDSKEVKINVVNRNSQPDNMITVLFAGDSLTFYNRIPDEFMRLLTSNDTQTTVADTLSIYDVVKPAGRGWGNIQLIGTQKNNHLGWTGKYPHEGYSGYSWADFISSKSPFYIDRRLDFNAYLTNNGFSTPDIIYIGLGWNDQRYVIETSPGIFDISIVMSNARTFLTALTTQLPNTKVRLWTENIPGIHGGIGNHPYGSNDWADEQRCKLIQLAIADGYKALIKNFPMVGLVWSTAQIDSENSLQETNAPMNGRITNVEVRGKDYVHPADAGFFQITDVLVSDFCTII